MKKNIEEIIGIGRYHFLDHSISHNQILYRSHLKPGNKDILFVGCKYLSIPLYITDFRIRKANESEIEFIGKQYTSRGAIKVFVIEEKRGYKHYIAANWILTQENDYEALETSIPIKREEPMTDEDIFKLVTEINELIETKGHQYVIDNYIQTSDWEILE